MYGYLPTLSPKMFQHLVGNYTIRGALWSWHAVDAVRAAVRVVCALWSWGALVRFFSEAAGGVV